MRDDLALAGMISPVACVEDSAPNGDEGVVEVRLESAVPMSVDECEGLWIGDRDMIWGNADDRACAAALAWGQLHRSQDPHHISGAACGSPRNGGPS